jgi:hypothetical protein
VLLFLDAREQLGTMLYFSKDWAQLGDMFPLNICWGTTWHSSYFSQAWDNMRQCFLHSLGDNILKCLLYLLKPETTWQSAFFHRMGQHGEVLTLFIEPRNNLAKCFIFIGLDNMVIYF